MAIQFDCPYCTATMQVPDRAMGTIGRCPKCQTRLRVPVLEIPSAVTQDAAADAGSAETIPLPRVPDLRQSAALQSGDSTPVAPSAVLNPSGDGLFRIDTSAPGLGVVTASPAAIAESAYLRKQRRRDRTWIWVAAAFLVSGAAIGGLYWWQARSDLSSHLNGQAVRDAHVGSVIAQRDFKIPDAEWANIRKSLEQRPANLHSSLQDVRMEAAPRGMKVTLKAGKDGELVAVPVLEARGLKAFVQANFDALDAPRRAAMEEALRGMAEKISMDTEAGKPPVLTDFGLPVVINGLTGPIGYHTNAIVGRKAYSCVFEDREGLAYYLLPPGIEQFTIWPKVDARGKTALPRGLRIHVTVSRKEVVSSPAEPATADRSPSPRNEPAADADSSEPQEEAPSP